MKVKSESEVAQSCPTLSDPMDYRLPGSSIHGIFQGKVLEWGAIAFSTQLSLASLKFKSSTYALAPHFLSPALGHKLLRVLPLSLSCIGEGNGNPLQCSCLENPWDRGAWWAAVYGVAQSWTRLKRDRKSVV